MEPCPLCPSTGTLQRAAGPWLARTCNVCGGSVLARDQAYQLIVVEGGHSPDDVGTALSVASPSALRCPDCGERFSKIQLGPVPLDLCAACGAAWLAAGDVERLEVEAKVRAPHVGPPHAEPPSPAAPPPTADVDKASALRLVWRRIALRPWTVLVALVVGVLVVVVGRVGAYFLLRGDAREESASSAMASSAEKYSGYFNHHVFGGRTVEWWEDRLRALHRDGAGADSRLYELTLQRARRAGLDVNEEGGRVKVTLKPEITELLLHRSGIE